jgi:hypothetical protein
MNAGAAVGSHRSRVKFRSRLQPWETADTEQGTLSHEHDSEGRLDSVSSKEPGEGYDHTGEASFIHRPVVYQRFTVDGCPRRSVERTYDSEVSVGPCACIT